jgi:hypothetical protein
MTQLMDPRVGLMNDEWYVTTPATVQSYVEGELITRPARIAHAKKMRTDRTACGEWAYSWRGLLEHRFPMSPRQAPGVEMCDACLARAIAED